MRYPSWVFVSHKRYIIPGSPSIKCMDLHQSPNKPAWTSKDLFRDPCIIKDHHGKNLQLKSHDRNSRGRLSPSKTIGYTGHSLSIRLDTACVELGSAPSSPPGPEAQRRKVDFRPWLLIPSPCFSLPVSWYLEKRLETTEVALFCTLPCLPGAMLASTLSHSVDAGVYEFVPKYSFRWRIICRGIFMQIHPPY